MPLGGTWSGSMPTVCPAFSARSSWRTPASEAGAVSSPGRARAVSSSSRTKRFSRRPVQRRHRPARTEALGIGLRRDLEAAQVRRQQHEAAAGRQQAGQPGVAVPAHRVGHRPAPAGAATGAAARRSCGRPRAPRRGPRPRPRRRARRCRACGGGSGRAPPGQPAHRQRPGRAETTGAPAQPAQQDEHGNSYNRRVAELKDNLRGDR
jgi:hypothetical protein